MNKEEVRSLANQLGIDLLGFTTCRHLEDKLPESLRPSQISEYLPIFLVLAKHIPAGISGANDREAKAAACSMVHRVLEEAATEFAYRLEAEDYLAVVLPPLMMDFKGRTELSNTPAGQGSHFLRLAAVEAGLGTLGLNLMLLTPQFGPRVYLYGMMTNLEVEPDEPLKQELCLGLEECGRCAAVCPGDAIPRQAHRSLLLEDYRGLDSKACAKHSQPYGVDTFTQYTKSLLRQQDPKALKAQIDHPTLSLLWYHMTILRQGAFTGCSKCLQVCPVGEDYAQVQISPHRKLDLPSDAVARVEGDLVSIDHYPGQQ
ncbi:hypothetical protein MYX82_01870 [Acidobacteria bacterium AH-259-D05]|nr:hypothetical protein [Acidobacteria bacterium AH-259-D05]